MKIWSLHACFVIVALACGSAAHAQEVESDVPVRVLDLQALEVSTQALAPHVFKIEGEGAYFLVNTSEGSVLIDTGTSYAQGDEQREAMREKATGVRMNSLRMELPSLSK